MPSASFIRLLADTVREQALLADDEAVVVAVSGGPDSMGLLHGLLALNEEAGFRLKLRVAHLNHLLRGFEAEKDAAFVQAAADSLELECTVARCDVAGQARQAGMSIEEFARKERYHLLERVCLQTGSKTAAVAHHAGDNAETILHRILRGTGLRGLAGIPVRRDISPLSDVRIVRPLLEFTREQILEFLSDRGIPFREDRSNASNEPMRNRLRNVVLPLLEAQVNPQVREALLRLGEQARWAQDYLDETAQRMFETLIISRNDQQLVLNVTTLARKDRMIQTELVRRAFASFELGQQDVGFGHIKAVLELIADPTSGKRVQWPAGMSVTRIYDRLVFSLPTAEPRETLAPEVAVHVPGVTHLPVRRMEIECRIGSITPDEVERWRREPHPLEEWADFDRVHPPLIVRARRTGDRFWPLGAPGSKKLSDFLSDAKVDPPDRDRVAVLCDRMGPLWIVGYRLDERVKLTRQTRTVLRLSARRLGSDA